MQLKLLKEYGMLCNYQIDYSMWIVSVYVLTLCWCIIIRNSQVSCVFNVKTLKNKNFNVVSFYKVLYLWRWRNSHSQWGFSCSNLYLGTLQIYDNWNWGLFIDFKLPANQLLTLSIIYVHDLGENHLHEPLMLYVTTNCSTGDSLRTARGFFDYLDLET